MSLSRMLGESMRPYPVIPCHLEGPLYSLHIFRLQMPLNQFRNPDQSGQGLGKPAFLTWSTG